MRLGIAIALLVFTWSAADEPGLAVGVTAPAFELLDQKAETRTLASLLAHGRTALVFYRSADW